MPKAYLIARIDVTDPEEYGKYTAVTAGIAARFGGRFTVRGGRFEAKEGPARARNAVIEFPDYKSALSFYDDTRISRGAAARAERLGSRGRHRGGVEGA